MEANDYIGKYVMLYGPGEVRRPLNLRKELFFVTHIRAGGQLALMGHNGEPASQHSCLMGEPAAVFDTLSKAKRALADAENIVLALEQSEINFKNNHLSGTPAGELVRKS